MLKNKDFALVDVHIPEQEHIAGTDLITPYDEIEDSISLFPHDKNAKIVLYCRSGSMSRAAAYTLAEHGYTNIYDLSGGKNAYDTYVLSSAEEKDLRASVTVGYIEFDATVVTEGNYEELLQQTEGNLPAEVKKSETTSILLVMNNHRENLGAYDFQQQIILDGVSPEKWEELVNGMGGHHISGLLTFPKINAPKTLTITGLPVGIVDLSFSSSEP
jgi:rhodanese-related sulfurtransferase